MRRALIAAAVYALALFCLGFVLGAVRVILIVPQLGELAATLIELPIMLTTAYFACRWIICRWRVGPAMKQRQTMALWFLVLLLSLEMLIGVVLFERTAAEQWKALTTATGLLGLTAQFIAAGFVLIDRKVKRP